MRMIAVVNLGRMSYGAAWEEQKRLVELRKQERIPNTLLFVEHPPVITLGRNAKESNIVTPRAVLEQKGVEVVEIDRGGDVTFHGPGQLVGYPIFDLRTVRLAGREKHLGVVDYVRFLEEALMRALVNYGLAMQRVEGLTGVWTHAAPPPRLTQKTPRRDYVSSAETADGEQGAAAPTASPDPQWLVERKIAAIGVHVSRSVTSHGFALNVTTDLGLFKLIVPCGLTKPVTSIERETGLRPGLEEVAPLVSRAFGELLGEQMLWVESTAALLAE